MFAALVTAACLAPVPGPHLGMTPAPPAKPSPLLGVGKFGPGWRWRYYEWELEIVRVEHEMVYFRNLTEPCKVWGPVEGQPGISRQSIAATMSEYEKWGWWPEGYYSPFTLTWDDDER